MRPILRWLQFLTRCDGEVLADVDRYACSNSHPPPAGRMESFGPGGTGSSMAGVHLHLFRSAISPSRACSLDSARDGCWKQPFIRHERRAGASFRGRLSDEKRIPTMNLLCGVFMPPALSSSGRSAEFLRPDAVSDNVTGYDSTGCIHTNFVSSKNRWHPTPLVIQHSTTGGAASSMAEVHPAIFPLEMRGSPCSGLCISSVLCWF